MSEQARIDEKALELINAIITTLNIEEMPVPQRKARCQVMIADALKAEQENSRLNKAFCAASDLRNLAQRYHDGDSKVPWLMVRDALAEWCNAHDEVVRDSDEICGSVGRMAHGLLTVECQRPKNHSGNHAGMGCEWCEPR